VPPLLLVIAFLFTIPYLSAQWVSFGVTGSVPISPQSHQFPDGSFFSTGFQGPNDLIQRPYAIGPTVHINLPLRLSVVAEFQYARMHEDFTNSGVKFVLNFGTRGGASANVWLFPLLLRYDLRRSRLSPFIDAGATLRHLSSFDGQGFQLDFFLHPQPATFHFPVDSNPKVAITAGAGVKLRAFIFDVAPEIRFEHWTALSFIPVQNQATLGVGITFPAR
jgi:hypothetical protein